MKSYGDSEVYFTNVLLYTLKMRFDKVLQTFWELGLNFKSHYVCQLNSPTISALTVEVLLMFFLKKLKSAPLYISFLDNTAGIVARRSSFTRKDRTQYLLPVVVTDSGSPALSSTNTLTISVCSCQPAGHCPTGGVEALALSMGVSLQTLLGIVVCFITLIGKKAGSYLVFTFKFIKLR